MSEADRERRTGPATTATEEIVADDELLRLAGIDAARFAALSDFEKRLVLKMAEQLVDAARSSAPPK